MKRSVVDLFLLWHTHPDSDLLALPHEIRKIDTDFAPAYDRVGRAIEIGYYSEKWSQYFEDEAAQYFHEFEGTEPCHVWVPGVSKDFNLDNEVTMLGECEYLIWEDLDGHEHEEEWTNAHMVGIDRSRIAIVSRATYVPFVLTNLRITPDGLDDKG